ncbi:MAG: hypothetical protein A3F09_02795 [Chlamydiae bacterium RIFCSPHIGHO2_12_FULL_49_11]|nr:MAG: hypothetical protein A3F09_02795 [Chlamydiae bacterium RIFCSPHIGHO2_12_FULL_49_11]
MVISNAAQSLLLVVNGALPNHLSRLSDPQRALLMQHFASKNPDPVRLGLIYTKLFEDPRRISLQILGMPNHSEVERSISRLHKEYPHWEALSWKVEGMLPFEAALKILSFLPNSQKKSLLNALKILEEKTHGFEKGVYVHLDADPPFLVISEGDRVILTVMEKAMLSEGSYKEVYRGASIDLIGPKCTWKQVVVKKVLLRKGNIPKKVVFGFAMQQYLMNLRPKNVPQILSPLIHLQNEAVFIEEFAGHEMNFLNFKMTALEKLRALKTVFKILDCIHNIGYIHGDLKMPNILMHPDGKIRLGDFDCATPQKRVPPEERKQKEVYVECGYFSDERCYGDATVSSDMVSLFWTLSGDVDLNPARMLNRMGKGHELIAALCNKVFRNAKNWECSDFASFRAKDLRSWIKEAIAHLEGKGPNPILHLLRIQPTLPCNVPLSPIHIPPAHIISLLPRKAS